MTKKLIILFFFITACGYQPIHLNKGEIFFKEISLIGDKKINRKIVSSLNIKINKEITPNNQIIFESSKNIQITSKDSKGQPKTFRTSIDIKLTILDNNKISKERLFSENFSYQNIDNKYDFFNYQKNIENNLVNKILDNINIFLKL